ncbi:unannotated protein [freshwater metagenome]|uniref:Unannotated protein n=1 Tax=freshwater metagenome TaxID=449393 RepID=A0A6J6G4B7_9ZZZZ
MSLDRANSALDVCDGLALGHLANKDFAIFGKGHDRGGCAGTFCVGDYRWLATFKYRYAAIGGSKVDSNCSSHCVAPFLAHDGATVPIFNLASLFVKRLSRSDSRLYSMEHPRREIYSRPGLERCLEDLAVLIHHIFDDFDTKARLAQRWIDPTIFMCERLSDELVLHWVS